MTARPPVALVDAAGRTLTIAGAGEIASITIEGAHPWQVPFFEFDGDEHMVAVAHELLERALATADCDELVAAVESLRALAKITCEHVELVERQSGVDVPYVVCSSCDAVIAGPAPF